jgi:hypothetical protein
MWYQRKAVAARRIGQVSATHIGPPPSRASPRPLKPGYRGPLLHADCMTLPVNRCFTRGAGAGRRVTAGHHRPDAGRRVVVIPPIILPDVTVHLADHTASGPDVIVFTSPGGKLLRNGNFRRDTWLPALAVTGLTGIHFHDLRHAGNQLIANAGANLRELMERMGHSTSRAALVYLHSTNDRQRELAKAVAIRTESELGQSDSRGTGVARPGSETD